MSTLPITAIKETCLYVADLMRTRDFYEGKLGLACFSFVPGSHAFFRAGTSVLLCFLPGSSKAKTHLPRHFGAGELHFAFEAGRGAPYDECLKLLKANSIAIEHEQTWPGGFRSVYFRDPDQHCVEVIEAGMWEYDPER